MPMEIYESPLPAAFHGNKENIDPQTGALSPTTRALKAEKLKPTRRALRDITANLKKTSAAPTDGGSQWIQLQEEAEVCFLERFGKYFEHRNPISRAWAAA